MAWNSPIDWVANQLVTVTNFNEQIRDNEKYLFNGRPKQSIKRLQGSNYSTSSTTFAAIDSTNLSITLTAVKSGIVMVGFHALMAFSAASNGAVDLKVDSDPLYSGSTYGLAAVDRGSATSIPHLPVAFTTIVTGLSDGNHTFVPYFKSLTTNNAVDLYSSTSTAPILFWAVEIG